MGLEIDGARGLGIDCACMLIHVLSRGCGDASAPTWRCRARRLSVCARGWQVHGDVFRAPASAALLSVYVGTGAQLLGMALVTMVFAVLGFLSPANRGGLMTAMLLLFVFMGIFGGYSAGRLYKTFKVLIRRCFQSCPRSKRWCDKRQVTRIWLSQESVSMLHNESYFSTAPVPHEDCKCSFIV